MAGPPEPPESILVGQFAGIKNTVERERLGLGDLEVAINVDIDDAGQARRRRGRTLRLAGNCHSLWRGSSQMLLVKDGVLGQLNTTYAFTPIAAADQNPISYTEVGGDIYYSSITQSGKIHATGERVEWGGSRNGEWLSPVVRPTETLGAISGKLLGPPPNASIIDAWNGRIYLAHENVLWATELFQFNHIDRTRGFLMFETAITALLAMNDGIFVGTERGLRYLSGTFAEGLIRKDITDLPILAGSGVPVPASSIKLVDGPAREGKAAIILSEGGALACFDGGEVVNLTTGRVQFPAAARVAALYREDSGVSAYVAATDNGGGRAANARVGDFVDAEIRRFQGG